MERDHLFVGHAKPNTASSWRGFVAHAYCGGERHSATNMNLITANLVNYLAIHTFKHPELSRPATSSSSLRDSRARARPNSSGLKTSVTWPADLAVDKPFFQKSPKLFDDTKPLAELLLKALLTGATPTSPSASSSSTRQTQAQRQQRAPSIPQPPPRSLPRQLSTVTTLAAWYLTNPNNLRQSTTNGCTKTLMPPYNRPSRRHSKSCNYQLARPTQQEMQDAGPQDPPRETLGFDRWNPADLGYLYSHLDKSYGEGEAITVGKDAYFQSVILLIDRVQDIAAVKGPQLVKANINTALRGTALL